MFERADVIKLTFPRGYHELLKCSAMWIWCYCGAVVRSAFEEVVQGPAGIRGPLRMHW